MGMISVLTFFVVGFIQGIIIPSWHVILILITYPIWGLIQQFLVIGLVAGNLQDLNGMTIRKSIIILSVAILFALIHYPHKLLIFGTFILALF